MIRSIREQLKLDNEKAKYRVYCKCGHSMFMPVYVKNRICGYCGRKVYRNEKEKFMEKMKEMLK